MLPNDHPLASQIVSCVEEVANGTDAVVSMEPVHAGSYPDGEDVGAGPESASLPSQIEDAVPAESWLQPFEISQEMPSYTIAETDPPPNDHAVDSQIVSCADEVANGTDAVVSMEPVHAGSYPDGEDVGAGPKNASPPFQIEDAVPAESWLQPFEISQEIPSCTIAETDPPPNDHAVDSQIVSCADEVANGTDAVVSMEPAHAGSYPDGEDVGAAPESTSLPSRIEDAAPDGHDVGQEVSSSAYAAATDDSAPASAEPVDVTGAMSRLEARIAQLEARRVDAWLERRLREFERMLAALDERMATSERGNISASGPIESGLQELRQRVETWENQLSTAAADQAKSFADKLEGAEARLRQTVGELRTRALEISGRLEAVEREKELHALAAEMPVMASNTYESQNATAPAQEMPSTVAEAPDAADESYLAAARRAALAAQSLARDEFGEDASRVGGRRRTRLLLGLCAGLGLVLAGTGVVLKYNFVSAAISGPAVAGAHSARLAASDRLPSPATVGAWTGDDAAKNMLGIGLAYLDGAGVAKDDMRAAGWIARAAMRGEPVAQYWLGTLYEHGRGERADPAEAIRWYEASALQGNLRAMYKLGVSYAEGWGTQKNYGESGTLVFARRRIGIHQRAVQSRRSLRARPGRPAKPARRIQMVCACGGAGRQGVCVPHRRLVVADDCGGFGDRARISCGVQAGTARCRRKCDADIAAYGSQRSVSRSCVLSEKRIAG